MGWLKKIFLFLFLSIYFHATVDAQQDTRTQQPYPGTNVRGRVIKVKGKQQYAYVSVRVDLLYFDKRFRSDQQWRVINSTYTDQKGYYYFKNVIPNSYAIQINDDRFYKVQIVAIDYRYYSFQDLPVFVY